MNRMKKVNVSFILFLCLTVLMPNVNALAANKLPIKDLFEYIEEKKEEVQERVEEEIEKLGDSAYDYLVSMDNSLSGYVSNLITNEKIEEFKNLKICNKEPLLLPINGIDLFEWNYEMTCGDNLTSRSGYKDTKIKVAIIDSGVNYSSDIEVKERKDFITLEGEDEISILYEDFSGHGTNIAGIIAAKDNEMGVTGGNPNVELYSAKVLDAANEAPIERVVSAIDWAIEKDVNIINLSFTTSNNSTVMHDAIKRAYDAGILLIAAAGNSGYVAYPAAYPEVVAVGSVNNKGEISSFSPIGNGIELVAPGELITSTDAFDTLSTHSGTSYATPHVTAIASKLWERDPSVSANYVRCVLDISANLLGSQDEYGYGLVDYSFACKVFDALRPLQKNNDCFELLMKYAISYCGIVNPNPIPVSEQKEELVEGAWWLDNNGEYEHMELLDGLNVKNTNGRALIMAGCVLADKSLSGLSGMTLNPYFHGYAFYTPNSSDESAYEEANYIAGGLYLTKIAKAMMVGNVYNSYSSHISIPRYNYSLNNIIDNTYLRNNTVLWSKVSSAINDNNDKNYSGNRLADINFNPDNKIHRALIIYGLSLHSFADIFSHSSVVNLNNRPTLIRHIDYNGYSTIADNVNFISKRNDAAKQVCQNALRMFSNMSSSSNTSSGSYSNYSECDISIFDISGTGYEEYFKLANFQKYANDVCNVSSLFSSWNQYNEYFESLDAGTYYNYNISSANKYYNPVTGEYQSTLN